MGIFKPDKVIDISGVELLHETDKAYLFQIEDKEVWLPKSLIEYDSEDKVVTLPERVAKDKELI